MWSRESGHIVMRIVNPGLQQQLLVRTLVAGLKQRRVQRDPRLSVAVGGNRQGGQRPRPHVVAIGGDPTPPDHELRPRNLEPALHDSTAIQPLSGLCMCVVCARVCVGSLGGWGVGGSVPPAAAPSSEPGSRRFPRTVPGTAPSPRPAVHAISGPAGLPAMPWRGQQAAALEKVAGELLLATPGHVRPLGDLRQRPAPLFCSCCPPSVPCRRSMRVCDFPSHRYCRPRRRGGSLHGLQAGSSHAQVARHTPTV